MKTGNEPDLILFSNRYKVPGQILVGLGIVGTVLYFGFHFRFEIPVLAVISSYLETRYFAVFTTNFTDEAIMLCYLAGFTLWVFSAEKTENEITRTRRLQAWKRGLLTQVVLLGAGILFVYGSTFMALVLLNVFAPFVFFLLHYHLPPLLRKR
ncbi:MAG: hypothetical protein R2751_05600 [Bacteroidales bacterium]